MRRRALPLLWVLSTLLVPAGCAQREVRPPDLEAGFRQIKSEPDRGEGYLELARRYFQRGDNLRARQYLTLAEKLPLSDRDALFNLALVIAVRAGQHDEAIRRCRLRLESSEDVHVRRLLAAILESLGRWDEAEIERRLVLEALPDDPGVVMDSARFYQRAPRADGEQRAARFYQRYLELAPSGNQAAQARAALRVLGHRDRPAESEHKSEGLN